MANENKEIATPPTLKVNVRTMQSDIQSLKESGGEAPQPYLTDLDNNKPVFTSSVPKLQRTNNKILFIVLGILVVILLIVGILIWRT